MRFAMSIPQTVAGGSFDPTGMDTYLAQAEELGFDSAWTGEQVLGTLPTLSPLETLAYAAARTRRIRLGCAMVVSPLQSGAPSQNHRHRGPAQPGPR
jgi:alkanesulfonate monooxygenase SsuD/methylene tetrahydromethanopterin reductase-like flavin-dependent oxidoreductase (luciferase family)